MNGDLGIDELLILFHLLQFDFLDKVILLSDRRLFPRYPPFWLGFSFQEFLYRLA
jgi:hypothetical protein